MTNLTSATGHKPTYNITEMVLVGKDLHVPNANVYVWHLLEISQARLCAKPASLPLEKIAEESRS